MNLALAKCNTLIIDDFQGMRTMLKDFVKSMGITKIDLAANGKEAIALLGANKYDIVICDYNLGPGQNGQQILEEAKHKKHIGYTAIWMMVTAEKTADMVMGAAETKPDDYLLKPINAALLEGRLEKLLSRKQSLGPIEKAVKNGDYATALALCDSQMKSQPAAAHDLLRIKADLLLDSGSLDAAKTLFEQVLAKRAIPWVKTGLGKVYFLSNDLLRAREIFQEVLEESKMYLEAADWLARTLEALGDKEQAQKVLQGAMELSPNSPTRQKNLADTAYRNGALDVAHAAYDKAIKLSEHSVHKNPAVYAGLAKVLTDKDAPQDALNVLNKSLAEFKGDDEAALQSTVLQSMAYSKMGDAKKAQEAIDEADKKMAAMGGKVSAEVTMDMAKSLFRMGDKDKACEMLQSVVKNNHDNQNLIAQVEAVFESEQLEEEGSKLIKSSQQEVIDINNQGVLLGREGKFEEGAKLLRKAAQNLPNNVVILMNLCGMLLGLLKETGRDDRLIYEAKNALGRVQELQPGHKNFLEYMHAVNEFDK